MSIQPRPTRSRPAPAVGDRVALLPHCPIDFEGVGPLPGMEGEIVSLPSVQDFRRCVGVRFEGIDCEWLIPSTCLKRRHAATSGRGD